jgi:hypothetical protein
MTVSGTTAFNMTVSEIVTDARERLGIQAEEEPLTDADLQRGIRVLNMMLLSWQADGVQTWVLTEGTFALVQGDYDYVFGSGGTFTTVPAEIMDVRITRSSQDLPMNPMSREEYYALPVKDTQGYPTQYYYDRQRDGGTFYVWPAPDATAGTIKLTYRRYINDAGNGTNTLDLPKEWLEAITTNLAVRLSPYYGGVDADRLSEVKEQASVTYGVLKSFDTAEGMSVINIWPDDNG